MLRVGDFSQLAQVSVRTLQYYDEIGLLKPASVDSENDYRYYALAQLPELNRILALKDLGFSLRQIEAVLGQALPVDAFRELLQRKRDEIAVRLRTEQKTLARLEARLQQLDLENAPTHFEIVLKRVSTLTIFSKRYFVPDLARMDVFCTLFYEELYGVLQRQGLESSVQHEFTLFHAREYTERDVDVEVSVVLEPAALKALELPQDETLTVRALPGSNRMASLSYEGFYRDLAAAGRAMYLWAGANGYASCGAAREVHLAGPILETGKDRPVVIELQVPVEKLAP